MKRIIYISLPLLGSLLAGCESEAGLDTPDAGHAAPLTVRLPMTSAAGGEETALAADLYKFDNGTFAGTQTVTSDGESVDLTVKEDTRVYGVAGISVEGLTASTTLEDFLSRTVASEKGAVSAPDFYSGQAVLSSGDEPAELVLIHATARIDLACQDPRIVIKEVIVENAPAKTLLIPAEAPLAEAGTVSYSRKIDESFDGLLQQAFTIFESAEAITIRVKGTFDGDPMNFAAEIPVVKRNKIYTIGVSGGTELNSSIGIADWKEGDNGEGILNLGEMAISKEHSVIPEGVVINELNNDITFPSAGVKDMKLAFLTKQPMKLGTVLGDLQGISITPLEAKAVENGYVSAFMIDVAAQPKCAGSYGATVFFNGASTVYIDMEVEPSPYQIPTVRIGGRDWMCFNAINDNVDDQVYIHDPAEIEKMYNENFTQCIGNYFQYGKPTPFSPWVGSDPNASADQTIDVPWRTVGSVPLPKGFHVATLADWAALIPNNTTIPASYMTASGDSIKATLVTLPGTLDDTPSASTNNQKYLKRYVLFESVTTGAKLYVPMAGIKTNSNVEIPTQPKFRFDTRSAYWMQEERYIMLIDYKATADGGDGAALGSNRWNALGFVMVRGVKD